MNENLMVQMSKNEKQHCLQPLSLHVLRHPLTTGTRVSFMVRLRGIENNSELLAPNLLASDFMMR